MHLIFIIVIGLLTGAIDSSLHAAASKRKDHDDEHACEQNCRQNSKDKKTTSISKRSKRAGGQPVIDACECLNWQQNPSIVIDGFSYTSDRIILPTQHMQWDWKAINPTTRHNPGVQVADVEALISPVNPADVCEIVIVSRGQIGVLQVNPVLLGFLRKEKCTILYDQLPNKSKCSWARDRLDEIADAVGKSQNKKPVILFLHTPDVVDFYNELVREGYKVSALIHLTC